MIRKQKTRIILLAILFVAMAAAYYFVVLPLTETVEEVVTETPETQEGEQLGTSNRYMMFEQIEKKNMQSIEVHNEYGTYTFYRDDNDEFQILGFENTPYDQELFSQLVVSTGYTLSKLKVVENATEQQLDDYGFGPDDNPAHYILTTITGDKHKVWVGNPILTGGGYYCMYDGRNAVYVLDTTLADTVLAPIENLVTPLVTTGVDQNDYFYIDDFTVFKGEDMVVSVELVPTEEQTNPEALAEHRLTYPAPYTVSSNNYYTILSYFVALGGEKTVKLGVTEEDLAEYGLDEPAYVIYFNYKELQFLIPVSELRDGYYYVLSPLCDLIAAVSPEYLGFLTWDLIDWIDLPLFSRNINTIDTIEIVADGIHETFTLTGESETLQIESTSAGVIPTVYNFRQYYKTLLSIQIEDEMTITKEEAEALIADDANMSMHLKITTRTGEVLDYKFYPYSTRRSVAVVNGNVEFYVINDYIDKTISDTKRVIADIDIESYGKN